MKNKLIFFAAFAVGAAIGSAASWQYFKKKYEKIAQEEIDSVKEYFGKSRPVSKEEPKEEQDVKPTIHKQDIKQYESTVDKLDYSAFSKTEKKEVKRMDKPYVITPDEFDTEDDYDCWSLTYYKDGYLADDDDNLIEDVEGLVGKDSLTHFGEYEDDSVFVRNDRLKCDYEILLDERNYTDVVGDFEL